MEKSKPPDLNPLNAETQWLYSELLLCDEAPHPIPEGTTSHPAKETYFGHVYARLAFFRSLPITRDQRSGSEQRSISKSRALLCS